MRKHLIVMWERGLEVEVAAPDWVVPEFDFESSGVGNRSGLAAVACGGWIVTELWYSTRLNAGGHTGHARQWLTGSQ